MCEAQWLGLGTAEHGSLCAGFGMIKYMAQDFGYGTMSCMVWYLGPHTVNWQELAAKTQWKLAREISSLYEVTHF